MKRRINLDGFLRKHLPVVNWLIAYSLKDALGDLLAGVTVGLTLIPQVCKIFKQEMQNILLSNFDKLHYN